MISPRLARSLVALLVLSSASVVAAAPPRLPIVSARDRALGTTVTVRGTVTVPTNAFDSGFAVQQGNAGIYILDSGDAVRTVDEVVEITGELVDSFSQLAIAPSSIRALGRERHIEPRTKRTGAVGEATEGRLLALEGQMVGDLIDDGVFGFKLFIDDGSGPIQIFLFPGTGISPAGLEEGVTVSVTCFSTQFEIFDECAPRSPADLEIY